MNEIGSVKDADNKMDILLAQWQTCVEMANYVSQRRDMMNNIFETLNLAIMAAVSLVWSFKSLFLLVEGLVVCVIWLFFIQNFKLLNSAKFQVINNLEESLPSAPFSDEWKMLKSNKKYMDGTKLEKSLPITFIILYATAIILVVLTKP